MSLPNRLRSRPRDSVWWKRTVARSTVSSIPARSEVVSLNQDGVSKDSSCDARLWIEPEARRAPLYMKKHVRASRQTPRSVICRIGRQFGR